MEILVKPSDEFCRQAKRFAKKYKSFVEDLESFQRELLQNPLLGVDLGGGKRKVRLNVTSKNKGKRSGMRIITYQVEQRQDRLYIFLVTIYDKSEYSNVSDRYVNQIIQGLQ